MIGSRSILLRQLILQSKNLPKSPNVSQIRNSAWAYRVAPPGPSKGQKIGGELCTGFALWWIVWHLYTEPGHVIGEWPEIEPSKWTDEELGIPPDSLGPAPRT